MSKLDDKDLAKIAAGSGHTVIPEPDGSGDPPSHDNIEDNAPPGGGGTGLEDEGPSGGSGGVGQG